MTFDPERADLVIGIVGAGTMGRGIAQLAATHGVRVLLADTRPGAVEEAEAFIVAMLERGVAKGRMARDEAGAAIGRIELAGDRLGAMARADVVVEAIVEDLEAKRALFGALEAIVGSEAVLATNTSSLSVTSIAAACRRPERVAGLHFFNPVPLMRVVEVALGELTAVPVRNALVGLVRRLGHQPVVTADSPGFVVNHAGRGLPTEALRIVDQGVAGYVDVDRIVRDVLGFRMGPFELMDLVGLDVSHAVMESIYAQFHHEPRFRPSVVTGRRVAAGLLGRKVGRGFYEYRDGSRVEPPEQLPAPATSPSAWIAPGAYRGEIAALLERGGVEVESGERPGGDAAIVLIPEVVDATTAALEGDYDAERVVALDTFGGIGIRLTVMATPVTVAGYAATVHRGLLRAGVAVSVVNDSVGFVAPRIAATIVNVACDMAQRRVATAIDIDKAVSLGLGYPEGPLAMGDRIGPDRVLRLLEALQAASGEPRYRPSPWLLRRARLGVSLTTSESAPIG